MSANRIIDKVSELADWDQPSFTDGYVARWNAADGKFVGAAAGGGADLSYTHVQNSPSTTWTINHNLGKYPSITVVDSAGTQVEGGIQHVTIDQAIATFSAGFSGKAFCN